MSFMPYGWCELPDTVRLDAEFGRQQMVYRDLADDAARDLANGIDHLTGLTMRLAAWSKIIQGLDVHEKNLLLHEFVQDLAAAALLGPYTLKARLLVSTRNRAMLSEDQLLSGKRCLTHRGIEGTSPPSSEPDRKRVE